tara:strand:+ start:2113 stop:3165 length:1053 start_codon:yes stop_codon:yes gene_type:complete
MSTFQTYNGGDIVSDNATIHSNTWSTGNNELTTFHTSSTEALNYATPSSSGQFYLDISATAPTATTAVEFSIAYGNKFGSGSRDFSSGTGGNGFSAAKTIYNQYRQLVYGDTNQEFTFQGVTPDDIYIINFERARIKQGLKPGSLNLKLTSGSSANQGAVHLTDDFTSNTGSAVPTALGKQFNLVSGSNGTILGTLANQTVSGSYGFVYPEAGIIILNPKALGTIIGNPNTSQFNITPSASNNGDGLNLRRFYNCINGGASFIVDSEETVTSDYFFTRITNGEFNYSTNGSFQNSTGDVRFDTMVQNPKVYITTIGLYNNNQELLAVAKLSKPLVKDFTKEALIRIKLDY